MSEPSPSPATRLGARAQLGVLAIAALAQALLLYAGFFSIAADESARALGAWDAKLADLIEPDVWPPFYELVNGLALRIYRELFVTPRILSFVTGLIVLWAIMSLADRMFGDRRVTLLTGLVGAFLPHRLLFSVAPMAEIYLFLFTILAARDLFAWLEDGRDRDAVMAGVWFGIATTIRYEAWVMAGLFAAFVLYRMLKNPKRRLSSLLPAMVIPLVFPAVWLIANLTSQSDLHFLSITSQQARTANPRFLRVAYNTAMTQFARDLILAPGLIAGVFALVNRARRHLTFRWWAYLMFSPVAIVTIGGMVTGSVPFAAPWRLGGTWTLLLLPFFSYALFVILDQAEGRTHLVGAVALIVMALVPLIARSAQLAVNSRFSVEELELGREVGRLIAETGGDVLIEPATGFSFLNVIVASNHPESFVLTIGPDPYLVALFISRPDAWKQLEPQLAERYLEVNYDFTAGVDPAELACEGIELVMTVTPEQTEAVRATAGIAAVGTAGEWNLFEPSIPCS
ncbi:MAG: glycosyltransferase family 39 protein [Acidimicrobiia bacterium]